MKTLSAFFSETNLGEVDPIELSHFEKAINDEDWCKLLNHAEKSCFKDVQLVTARIYSHIIRELCHKGEKKAALILVNE